MLLSVMLQSASPNSNPPTPPVGTVVWRSSGAFINSSYSPYALGTASAAWAGGGQINATTYTTAGANFNGTTWSNNANVISSGRVRGLGLGTYSAGIIYGGFTGAVSGIAQTFNGTSFTTITASTAKMDMAGCGTQTAAFFIGGFTSAAVNATSIWNGAAWVAGGNLSVARQWAQGAGTSTDAVCAGGTGAANYATAEKYNGTSWSSIASMAFYRARGVGIGASSADCKVVGGLNTGTGVNYTSDTFSYDGTAWSTTYGLRSSRTLFGGAGGTTNSTSGIVVGGRLNNDNVTSTNTTEIMATDTSISGGVWGGYAYPVTGRQQGSGFGTADACIAAGGYISTPAGYSVTAEASNGVTWASTTSMPNSVQVGSGVGTSTAGGVMMGLIVPGNLVVNLIRLFNGTTWSAGASNSVGTYFSGGFGLSTSACGQAGGLVSGGTLTAATYLYNGTSWSTSNSLPVAYYSLPGAGPQTDGMVCGGLNQANVSQNVAYKFNGTTWSSTGNMVNPKDRHAAFGATSSLVVASGVTVSAVLQPAERFTGTTWAQVGTPIGVRYQRPTSSSQAATTGIVVSGLASSGGTVYQWGAEKYYD